MKRTFDQHSATDYEGLQDNLNTIPATACSAGEIRYQDELASKRPKLSCHSKITKTCEAAVAGGSSGSWPNLPFPFEIREKIWKTFLVDELATMLADECETDESRRVENGHRSFSKASIGQRECARQFAMEMPILWVNQEIRRECLPLRRKQLKQHLEAYTLANNIVSVFENPIFHFKHVTICLPSIWNAPLMTHWEALTSMPTLQSLTINDSGTDYFRKYFRTLEPHTPPNVCHPEFKAAQEKMLCTAGCIKGKESWWGLLPRTPTFWDVDRTNLWIAAKFSFRVFWRLQCNEMWDIVIDLNDTDDLRLIQKFKESCQQDDRELNLLLQRGLWNRRGHWPFNTFGLQ